MASLNVRLGLVGGLAIVTAGMVFLGKTTSSDGSTPDPASLNAGVGSEAGGGLATTERLREANTGALDTITSPQGPESEFRFGPPDGKNPDVLAQTPLNEAFERLIAGDYKSARRIAEPFAEEGNPDARHLIGYLFERGLGVQRDLSRALSLYSQAASDGNLDAMLALGDLAMGREEANGVARDIDKAIGWYRMGERNGDARAQARLGSIYANPGFDRRDMNKAIALFEQAAERADPDAHYALGVIYLEGDARSLDYQKAASHFEAAAKAGHAPAAYNLGLIYDTPFIGPPDAFQAAEWFTRSANAGYGPAMTALGLFAHRGDTTGSPADWFEKAAKAGDPQGRFLYAVALAKGDGREPDTDLARNLASDIMSDPNTDDTLKANARALLASINGSQTSRLKLRN